MATGERDAGTRRWVLALLAVCALGLAIRVGYVTSHELTDIGGDARYYHEAANLLADGDGFIHPFYLDDGRRVPGADHPPAYQVALALPSLLGFDSVRDHQLFSALLGTVTVGLVGLAGRQVAGKRTGLIAAALTAVYPNVWLNDGALMSETLALLAGVVVVMAAYWCWESPSARRFALVGAAVGFATLARAEAALLVPLVAWPLALRARGAGLDGWRPRLGRLALASGVAALVLVPWVGPNLVRFQEPATLSTQLGPTLDVANCDETYAGPALGSWSFACAMESDAVVRAHPDYDTVDRSVIDGWLTDRAIAYARDHTDRWPAVVAARLGRTVGVYAPSDQLRFDRFAENRPMSASRVGLAMFYPLAIAAVAGAVVLRTRGVPSFPLVAGVVSVLVTVVLFYGSTRFRAPAEPSIVLLAAVAVDALVRRLRHEEAPRAAASADAPANGISAPSPGPAADAGAGAGRALEPAETPEETVVGQGSQHS